MGAAAQFFRSKRVPRSRRTALRPGEARRARSGAYGTASFTNGVKMDGSSARRLGVSHPSSRLRDFSWSYFGIKKGIRFGF